MDTPLQSKTETAGTLRSDFQASVVVFLVALPLCMGIAIASGAPVATGLISGIVGGLVAGALAGCPLQVSGPAAGLTVIVFDMVQRLGLEILGLAVLLAGLIQVAAGLLRVGQWFRAVSPAVIKGMLAGIGFLILGSQFHVMIDDAPRGSGSANLASIPEAIGKSFALPVLADREVREYHAAALRSVGEVHRQQIALQELLSEHAPHSRPSVAVFQGTQQPGKSEAAAPLPSDVVTQLIERQAAITGQLNELVDRLTQFERSHPDTPRAGAIQTAASVARQQCRVALADLKSGQLQTSLASQKRAIESQESLLQQLKNHHLAAWLGLFTIAVIVFWQTCVPKKYRVVPAPLIAVVLATLLTTVMTLPVLYVEIPDSLWNDIRYPTMAVLNNAPWAELWGPALLIAVVASAQTLLTATAVDQMHSGPRTRYDKELISQGVGNTLCGLLGALPLSGVIVRSSANIQSGARTRLSTILHGLWLLIFVVGLAPVLRLIPTSSLAAMLVYTGYKLVDVKSLTTLRQYGWWSIAIYAATVITIVFTDLLSGVLVGIGCSMVRLLLTMSRLHVDLNVSDDGCSATVELSGAATFLRLPQLASTLEQIPTGCAVRVNLDALNHVDHACLDLLNSWSIQHSATGGSVELDWESLRSRFDRRPGQRMVNTAGRSAV